MITSNPQYFQISRSEKYIDPKDNKEYILGRIWSKGSFVPLGAKLSDGSVHPHAGTGFGGCTSVGYPADFKTRSREEVFDNWENYTPVRGLANPHSPNVIAENPHPVNFNHIHQYSYDGKAFKLENMIDFRHPDSTTYDMNHPGWGLRSGIPDEADILFPLSAKRKSDNVKISGIARWQHKEDGWQPTDFTPVPGTENSMEPTIERGRNEEIYFTCRSNLTTYPESNSIRIWVSKDNGKSWEKIIEEKDVRASSPVTINRAADGTIFILGNPLDPEKKNREILAAWPLSKDGLSLEKPIVIFNSTEELGYFRDKYDWYIDHPISEVILDKAGTLRCIITFRCCNRMEVGYDLPLTEFTGTYMTEVFSDGVDLPRWEFQEPLNYELR
ncbi:MAG: sialidase family protein [Planctomycetota bacterium]